VWSGSRSISPTLDVRPHRRKRTTALCPPADSLDCDDGGPDWSRLTAAYVMDFVLSKTSEARASKGKIVSGRLDGMSNVLSDDKKQQVIALGKLGWTLRRIEQATGVRRETASGYLKAAGIAVRPSGSWGRRPPSKPANEVTTDSERSKPANEEGVTTDFNGPFPEEPQPQPPSSPSASVCEPFRETIESDLNRGRNAGRI